jgi:hypothetical protein
MIPSGYKTSKVYCAKPTDGAGDLTFTRSNDTATRVGPDGLIEKVRTNLLLQSNTFSTTWSTSSATITGGQAGYDGTNNAWLLGATANSGYIGQAISASVLHTESVYAKAGTLGWVLLLTSGGGNAYFNLTTGVVGSSSGILSAKIESVGGGWYRCSISQTSTTTTFRIYPAFADGNLNSSGGNILIQNAQLETGDIATQPILTTTAAVSVGPVANVPRLDYLNSSCPRLLLEPQLTNLCVYSENLDNAVWTKINTTVTANNTTAPDGYLGADRISEDTVNSAHAVERVTTASAGTYTFSIFIKKGTRRYAGMRAVVNGYTNRYFSLLDLDTGLIVSNNTVGTGVTWTSSVENYGNGWYRLIITGNHTASNITLLAALSDSATPTYLSGAPSYQGIASENGYFWGAQIEAGAYATSYIPTLGAAVTRGAEAATKTSATALIGQTEGTFFAEVDFTDTNADQMYLTISDGTTNNRIHIGFDNASNWLYCNIRSGGAAQGLITQSSPSSGIKKIAVGYKLNDYVLYINGVQVGVDSSALVPACSRLDVGGYFTAGYEYPVKQALLFNTRLPNSDLAALTTL